MSTTSEAISLALFRNLQLKLPLHVVTDYGAIGDGVKDDTRAIQTAIDESRDSGGVVVLPFGRAGIYLTTDTIYAQRSTDQRPIRFIGLGPTGSFFNRSNAIRIRRKAGYSHTIMYGIGHNLELSHFVLDGNMTVGDGLVIERGFELRMDGVRAVDCIGYGMSLYNLSNAQLDRCFVDNCARDDSSVFKEAFKVSGKSVVGSNESISNTVFINGLHVERSRATAVGLANGSNPYEQAEFIRFNDLHVEQTIDNTSMATFSEAPVVHLGNVRGCRLRDPYIYGGKGELLRLEKFHAVSGDRTSVTIDGADIMGHNNASGRPDILVHCVAGDYIKFVGAVELSQPNTSYLQIDSGVGADVIYSDITLKDRIGPASTEPNAIIDNRGNRKGLRTFNATWIENALTLISGKALFRLFTDGTPAVESTAGQPFDMTKVAGLKLPVISDAATPAPRQTLYIEQSNGKPTYKDSSGVNHSFY